jgi:hypothetical protein
MNYKDQVQIATSKTDHGYILEVKLPASVLFASTDKPVAKAAGLVGQTPEEKQACNFIKGSKIGISIDPSYCDDPNSPQKVLMSSSVNRVWGDPTTFGIMELD